jgi:hypothetical protein
MRLKSLVNSSVKVSPFERARYSPFELPPTQLKLIVDKSLVLADYQETLMPDWG